MRNPILPIAIAFMLAVPCTALAGDKKSIEVNSWSWGGANSSTTSRSDGGGATVGRKNGTPGLTAKGTLGGSTGPTRHIEAITVKQK